jgi:hypothetical protein
MPNNVESLPNRNCDVHITVVKMTRRANVRSLCYGRKSGEDLADTTLDDPRNSFHRHGLLMIDELFSRHRTD